MRATPLGPLAALVGVQFAFATFAVAAKFVLNAGVPPLAAASIRVFFAALLLAALGLAVAQEHVRFVDAMRLAGLGFLGVAFNQLAFIEGLARTTAVNGVILPALIPVFTLVLAVALRHEHFDARRAAGVLVAFLGAMVLIEAERLDFGSSGAVGNLLLLLSTLSYSLYLVLARPLLQRFRTTTLIAWAFLFGALMLAPLGVPDVVATRGSPIYTPMVWAALAWVSIIGGVVAYGLNAWALKRVPASTVAGLIFLQPLIGVALSLALLPDERVGPRTILAGILIVAGVLVVARTQARTPPARPASP